MPNGHGEPEGRLNSVSVHGHGDAYFGQGHSFAGGRGGDSYYSIYPNVNDDHDFGCGCERGRGDLDGRGCSPWRQDVKVV